MLLSLSAGCWRGFLSQSIHLSLLFLTPGTWALHTCMHAHTCAHTHMHTYIDTVTVTVTHTSSYHCHRGQLPLLAISSQSPPSSSASFSRCFFLSVSPLGHRGWLLKVSQLRCNYVGQLWGLCSEVAAEKRTLSLGFGTHLCLKSVAMSWLSDYSYNYISISIETRLCCDGSVSFWHGDWQLNMLGFGLKPFTHFRIDWHS